MSEIIPLVTQNESDWDAILHPVNERRDAMANRARLLDAARALFAEQGVANVSMAEIATSAGVGKGTLYRRFANKGELCLALLDENLRGHEEEMLELLQRLAVQDVAFVERLTTFLGQVARFTDIHIALLFEAQQSGVDPGDAGMDPPYFHFQQMTVRGLLRSAQAAGEIDAGLDVGLTTDLLLAPLIPAYFRYLRQRRGHSVEVIAASLQEAARRLVLINERG